MIIGIGNRNVVSSMNNGRSNRGRKRIRGEGRSLLNVTEQLWIHPDARDCMTDMVDDAMEKVSLKKEKI